ncbi:hypothetical protein BD560DRAFT_388936 [Blakeslea trispora]|nr:hypothetical protein BD560DRAFT_388936 [Blakeslea trispora]
MIYMCIFLISEIHKTKRLLSQSRRKARVQALKLPIRFPLEPDAVLIGTMINMTALGTTLILKRVPEF